MKRFILIAVMVIIPASFVNATVIEVDVITGKSIERGYTQKELNDIEARTASPKRTQRANKKDAMAKRKAAIEAMLMSSNLAEAVEYRSAKAKLSP